MNYFISLCKKVLFSGIELICEFLRTMLNHSQFLLSIVCYSFYLFVKFAEVSILKGKADAYKELICIVERVHFHVRVGVKNLKNIFSPPFIPRCCNSFRQRYKATNVTCFFSKGKFHNGKINQTRSLENSNNNVGQRKRYRDFADYLCCLPIFPAKLSVPHFPSRHESTHVFVMLCILIFFGSVLFFLKF